MGTRVTSLQEQEVYEHESMLSEVLRTKAGRHILFHIIGKGDLYSQQFDMSYEAAIVQRQLGRREVALEVLKEILTAHPDAYNVMQKEAVEFFNRFRMSSDTEEDEDNG